MWGLRNGGRASCTIASTVQRLDKSKGTASSGCWAALQHLGHVHGLGGLRQSATDWVAGWTAEGPGVMADLPLRLQPRALCTLQHSGASGTGHGLAPTQTRLVHRHCPFWVHGSLPNMCPWYKGVAHGTGHGTLQAFSAPPAPWVVGTQLCQGEELV